MDEQKDKMRELEVGYNRLNQKAYILAYAQTILLDDSYIRHSPQNDPLKESLLDKEQRAVNTSYFAGIIG